MVAIIDVEIGPGGDTAGTVENTTPWGTSTPETGFQDLIDGVLSQYVSSTLRDLMFPRRNVIHLPCAPPPKNKNILYDRRDPVFVVIIQGKNIKKTNISRLISSVEVDETEDGFDTCTVEFESLPEDYVDDPIFNARNKLEIFMGYQTTGIEYMGQFIIDKPEFFFEENINVVMKGKLINLRMAESEKQEVHTGMSDLELAAKLAQRNGFLLAVNDATLRDTRMGRKKQTVAQAGMSDWDTLRKRCIEHGYVSNVIFRQVGSKRCPIIYIGPPRNCDYGIVLSYKDPNPYAANLMTFRPTENTYKRNSAVKLGIQNPRKIGPLGHGVRRRVERIRERFDRHENPAEYLVDMGDISEDERREDPNPTSQHVCVSDPDRPGGGSYGGGGPGDRPERPYEAIIGSNSSSADGLSVEEQRQVRNLVTAGVSLDKAIRDTKLRRTDEPLNDSLTNRYYLDIDDEIRTTIITDHGCDTIPDEACDVVNRIHESLKYVVEAEAEPAVGHPKIRKGTTLTVKGVGKFSGRYYVKSCTHIIDSSGYRMPRLSLKSKGTKKNSKQKAVGDDRIPIPIVIPDLLGNDKTVIEHIIHVE